MEALSDLNTFAKILTDKGYNGYFHTQGAYAGKLKDSISKYLENCQKGADTLPEQNLLLTGYLQWSGEDKPRVECNMWVKYQDGKFSLNKMEVIKKDGFGQLLKKSELANLSVLSAPKAMEAVALVNDPKLNTANSPKRFKL
ncbi:MULTISPECIES: hypothetical protein [unclassified Arcicella]|jgi:hypothetical protein|uniref:hypothetical protein n=1 Tax=unclassified Arcicella TaxID=2644986 RepID=UPI0028593EF4|nr:MULTISPECIES: hypothetical protein [unclassified Arcicella]MCA6441077.1 hypothetical protein [Chitinophagaceae bacterium]MCA6447809.1 hypothetical protein [Chitinophagaceae bacterium]MDR6561463.1 hypothetical protein [Arcicella sp. BE51]MDR6811347.1 hypothetical protein [Arcicella sp. BE140]MDR6822697.1 hypothetical protein [Arcicella sp. BE139]